MENLEQLISKGDWAKITEILDGVTDSPTGEGENNNVTILHKLSNNKEIAKIPETIIEKIIKKSKKTINNKNSKEETALHMAIAQKQPCTTFIKYLLDYKANIDLEDRNGYSPLFVYKFTNFFLLNFFSFKKGIL